MNAFKHRHCKKKRNFTTTVSQSNIIHVMVKKSYQNTPVIFLLRSNAQRISSAALSDCYRKETWQQFFNLHLKTCYQKAANGSLRTDEQKVKSEIGWDKKLKKPWEYFSSQMCCLLYMHTVYYDFGQALSPKNSVPIQRKCVVNY